MGSDERRISRAALLEALSSHDSRSAPLVERVALPPRVPPRHVRLRTLASPLVASDAAPSASAADALGASCVGRVCACGAALPPAVAAALRRAPLVLAVLPLHAAAACASLVDAPVRRWPPAVFACVLISLLPAFSSTP